MKEKKECFDSAQYREAVKKTECSYGETGDYNPRLLHAALGLVTEASEVADHIKKREFYRKPIPTLDFMEEVGDLMWYLAVLLEEFEDTFGTRIELSQVLRMNITKLKKRYGENEGFSKEKAIERE